MIDAVRCNEKVFSFCWIANIRKVYATSHLINYIPPVASNLNCNIYWANNFMITMTSHHKVEQNMNTYYVAAAVVAGAAYISGFLWYSLELILTWYMKPTISDTISASAASSSKESEKVLHTSFNMQSTSASVSRLYELVPRRIRFIENLTRDSGFFSRIINSRHVAKCLLVFSSNPHSPMNVVNSGFITSMSIFANALESHENSNVLPGLRLMAASSVREM